MKSLDNRYCHGYTLFDKKGIEPKYPFGYDFSYIDFEIDNTKVSKKENTIEVPVKVKKWLH